MNKIRVIGAGLAGSEAAIYLAKKGYNIDLFEMRPKYQTGAHTTDYPAEFVCSNSLGSTDVLSASGLLKQEAILLGSTLFPAAVKNKVPSGNSLSIDRFGFCKEIKEIINSFNNISIVNEKYELVFFHYSGFDSGANQTVFDYYVPDKKNYIYKLRNEYIKEMNEYGQQEIGNYQWTYDRYFNGQKIDRNIRIEYRNKKFYDTIDTNPFSLSNEHLDYLMNGTLRPSKGDENSSNASPLRTLFRRIVPLKIRKFLKHREG